MKKNNRKSIKVPTEYRINAIKQMWKIFDIHVIANLTIATFVALCFAILNPDLHYYLKYHGGVGIHILFFPFSFLTLAMLKGCWSWLIYSDFYRSTYTYHRTLIGAIVSMVILILEAVVLIVYSPIIAFAGFIGLIIFGWYRSGYIYKKNHKRI